MKWKVLQSKEIFSSGFFKLKEEKCELPDGRVMPRYYVMDFADWVNILPVTSSGQLILVKQYRHASGKTHLEIPGGAMDPFRSESPMQGAQREMTEETGYSSSRIEKVGSHYPNPALQSNQLHTFIAWDCEKTQPQNLDEFEDLELYFCSVDRLKQHLLDGDIDHSLMAASISMIIGLLEKSESR